LPHILIYFLDTPQCAHACGVFIGFVPAWSDVFCITLLPITVFDRH